MPHLWKSRNDESFPHIPTSRRSHFICSIKFIFKTHFVNLFSFQKKYNYCDNMLILMSSELSSKKWKKKFHTNQLEANSERQFKIFRCFSSSRRVQGIVLTGFVLSKGNLNISFMKWNILKWKNSHKNK
jgi:hypothetical protein